MVRTMASSPAGVKVAALVVAEAEAPSDESALSVQERYCSWSCPESAHEVAAHDMTQFVPKRNPSSA